MALTNPLKWHGGKSYLAKHIISLMPPRCKNPNAPDPNDDGWLHFVEPYAGGLAVLLANDPNGISEVANDINGWLSSFWQVMMNHELFDAFLRHVQGMPFAESLWNSAMAHIDASKTSGDPVSDAVAFFVACRQSMSGRMDSFAPLSRNRCRSGMNEQASAWLNAIEGLPAVHERLKRVVILNRPALEVIAQQDGPRTLFYLDPPYAHETRVTTTEYGENEMSEDDHRSLLQLLTTLQGRFLLSGYRSTMYDGYSATQQWNRHDFSIDNKASSSKKKPKMVEAVWMNY